jgi:hypothetical protein
MMRRSFVLIPIALTMALAACGQSPERSKQDLQASDVREEAAPADAVSSRAPGIAVSSAPGVAFNYRYAFRVPNAKIAAVQEDHAQACEKLGLDRCRITGMRYRLVSNDEVSAMLAFKLDPTLARDFGKQGIAAVTKAAGMLIDSEITGTDAGAVIDGANRQSAALRDELAKVEEQLKRAGLSASERVELTQQAADLRDQMRSASATRTDARESLATTPMIFDYGSGDLIPGFDGASPIREAFRTASGTFVTMLGFAIIAIGALLPWALLGGLVLWIYRSLRKSRVAQISPDAT